ncbi:hypothetical protein ACWZQY_024015 [Priestia megaterium]
MEKKAFIPFGYQLPTEKSRSSTMMSLDEFTKKCGGAHIKDAKKIRAVKNKTLYMKAELEYKVGRILRYFALHVPSRAA